MLKIFLNVCYLSLQYKEFKFEIFLYYKIENIAHYVLCKTLYFMFI